MYTCSITILYFYLNSRGGHETDLTYFSDWQPQQGAVCDFCHFPYVYNIHTFMQAAIKRYYLLSKSIGIVVKYIDCIGSNK